MHALVSVLALGSSLLAQTAPPASDSLFSGRLVEVRDDRNVRDFVTADLNRDGHQDVITSSGTPFTAVSVLLGDGRGGLTWHMTRETPELGAGAGGTSQTAVLDCDADGLLDVVTSGTRNPSNADGFLLVFEGDGTGALATPWRIALPMIPSELRAADMNGDGRLDLITTVYRDLAVLLRRPQGGFEPPAYFNLAPNNYVGGLEIGDISGDGAPDVLYLRGSWPWWLRNSGSGSLLPAQLLKGLGTSQALRLGDFDGIGALDIASITAPGVVPYLSLFTGDGAGGFDLAARVPLEWDYASPRPCFVSDLKTGPPQELIVSVKDGLRLVDLTAAGAELSGPIHPGIDVFDPLVLADFDEDGHDDLVELGSTELGLSAVALHFGTGEGTLRQVLVSASGFNVPLDQLHDLDGDGELDALGFGIKYVLRARGEGGGRFAQPKALRAPGWISQVLPADFDGDGVVDLMQVGYWPFSVSLARGTGAFGFEEPRTLELPKIGQWPSDALHAVCADLDADGRAEIALNVPKRGTTAVIGAGSDGFPVVEDDLPTHGTVGSYAARDLDGNGQVDVLYLVQDPSTDGTSKCSLWSFQHQATGGYEPARLWMDLPLGWVPGIQPPSSKERWGPRPEWLQLADLDGDGLTDVLARRELHGPPPFYGAMGNQIASWLRLPGGAWSAPHEQRWWGLTLEGAGAIDLEGDGQLELAWGLYEPISLAIWRLENGIAESRPECYSAPHHVFADVDHDGQLDAVGSTWRGLATYLHRGRAVR
jgi:hypothetical protein